MAKAGAGGGETGLYATPPMTFTVTWQCSNVDDVNYFCAIQYWTGSNWSTLDTAPTSATSLSVIDPFERVVNGTFYPEFVSWELSVAIYSRADYTVVERSTAATLGPYKVGHCDSIL